MPHRHVLLVTLLTLATVGGATLLLAPPLTTAETHHLGWWFFLVILPLMLASVVLMGWAWAAIACVVYGTIGLALDLATAVSMLGGHERSVLTLALTVVSGSANFAMIVFGGRGFWTALQRPRPQ
jgi:hypothetical protein